MRILRMKKGVTLIELLLVLAIISMIILITVPRIKTTNYWLKSNSKMLRDDIRYIRYMKMVEGKNCKILLGYDHYCVVENGRERKRVVIENDLKIVHNFYDGNVYFSHIGSPNQGGTIKIIDDKTNKYCEITIVPATGRVLLKNQIFEGYN